MNVEYLRNITAHAQPGALMDENALLIPANALLVLSTTTGDVLFRVVDNVRAMDAFYMMLDALLAELPDLEVNALHVTGVYQAALPERAQAYLFRAADNRAGNSW